MNESKEEKFKLLWKKGKEYLQSSQMSAKYTVENIYHSNLEQIRGKRQETQDIWLVEDAGKGNVQSNIRFNLNNNIPIDRSKSVTYFLLPNSI